MRCKMIIHVVNGDSNDPVRDFLAINRELQLFSPELAGKPQVVVLNKIDVPQVAQQLPEILAALQQAMPHKRLLPISAAGRQGLDYLIDKTWVFLQKVEADAADAADAARGEQQPQQQSG